jgi:hypothetical protein
MVTLKHWRWESLVEAAVANSISCWFLLGRMSAVDAGDEMRPLLGPHPRGRARVNT